LNFKGKNVLIKIAVVDDNELHLQLIAYLLKKEGFEVFTFKSGIEGLNWLKDNKADVILLDLQLPIMNGIEILTEIKRDERHKNMKTIAITAQQKYEGKSFTEYGFDGHILKPINSKKFSDDLKKIININNQNN
jgi:DNA-binding response OmpR family regulator